ncbi:MAG: DUF4932 domain-containing protein [Candidatus Cloacimonetes bacterium]|nr:DUF4932 domain-containing protein [Candidatus Cloacimonadota bacterium]
MTTSKDKLTISVDPRIELLSIIQYFASHEGFDPICAKETEYVERISAFFSGFRNHPAIKFYEKMSASDFSYDAPPNLMMHLSITPKVELIYPLSNYIMERTGGENIVYELIDHLNDFIEETCFMAFYENNQAYYNSVVALITDDLGNNNHIAILEEYYGMEQNSYSVVIAPLFSGNYGSEVNSIDGSKNIFSFQDLSQLRESKRINGTLKYQMLGILWHEFSHSFINPLTKKHLIEVMKYQSLFKDIEKQMKEQAYSTWETCVNELIIRAVTCRFIILEFNDLLNNDTSKYQGDYFDNEERQGFIYIRALYHKLTRYESNRDKYRTIDEFYIELLSGFKEYLQSANQ